MQSRRIGLVLFVLVLAAVVGFAVARLSGSGFHWAEFAASLGALDPVWGIAAIGLNLSSYVIRALRWRVMMSPVRADASVRSILSATAIGFTAVILFGRPGELVRPWLISVREKVTFSSQIAAWFLERVLDLLSVVLLFGVALSGLRSTLSIGQKTRDLLQTGGSLAVLAGLGCVAFLLVAALFSERAKSIVSWLCRYLPDKAAGFLRRSLDAFLTGLQSTGDLRTLIAVLGWTAVEWALICGAMYSVFQAFPPTAEFTVNDTLVFAGFVAFGSVVQLPGIGGGMQVASVLILTELFGLGLATATACTLLVWGVNWLAILPFGLILALTEGVQWQNLRNISKVEAETAQG